MKSIVRLALGAILLSCESAATHAAGNPPQWLKIADGEQALKWAAEQNARTSAALKRDRRYRDLFDTALSVLTGADSMSGIQPQFVRIADGWIYLTHRTARTPLGKWQRARLQEFLAGQPRWETLIDLDELKRAGGHSFSILGSDIRCLAPHNARCLVRLIDWSSNQTQIREFDLLAKRFVSGGFVSPAAKDSTAAWLDDDTIAVAVPSSPAHASVTGRASTVRLWKRGTPLERAPVMLRTYGGADAGVANFDTGDGKPRVFLYSTTRADGSEYWLWDGAKAEKLPLPRGSFIYGFVGDEMVFSMQSASSATEAGMFSAPLSQVMRGARPFRQAQGIASESSSPLNEMTARGFVSTARYGWIQKVTTYTGSQSGWRSREIPPLGPGIASLLGEDTASGLLLFRYEDKATPPALYSLNAGGEWRRVLSSEIDFDPRRYVSEPAHARSADGTEVPYLVIRDRGRALDGAAPTLMHGYGALGSIADLRFDPIVAKLWLERGGSYVVTSIRGDGDLGPSWHLAKTERQHTYDDFAAIAADLVRRGITSPRHLGAEGFSAGGTLMGAMLALHPERFNALSLEGGYYDMLDRSGGDSQDGFDFEFGSAQNPIERAFLEKTSPLAVLKAGMPLPIPFISANTTDLRVPPKHGRLLAFRLEQLGYPYYYWEIPEGGHSFGTEPENAATFLALKFTYLSRQLNQSDVAASPAGGGRPISVPDLVTWAYLDQDSPKGSSDAVGIFSPDRARFVVHVKRGDLRRKVNVDSLLLYSTREVEEYIQSPESTAAPTPVPLVEVAISNDWECLCDVAWLDATRVGFISTASSGRLQAFSVDIRTRAVTQRTFSKTDVVTAAHAPGATVYLARVARGQDPQVRVLAKESLAELLSGNHDPDWLEVLPLEVFVGQEGSAHAERLPLPAMRIEPSIRRLWIAPSGNYALLLAPAVNAPSHWARYRIPDYERAGFTAQWVRNDATSLDLLLRVRHFLVDLRRHSVRPLMDAPSAVISLNRTPPEVFWPHDEQSVIVSNAYLPLDGGGAASRRQRERYPATAQVDLKSGEATPIIWEPVATDQADGSVAPQASHILSFDWHADKNALCTTRKPRGDDTTLQECFQKRGRRWVAIAPGSTLDNSNDLTLTVRESLNERPRLYANDRLLLDPNPQAQGLTFAAARVFKWTDAHGIEWSGGLLLPRNYQSGTRYPLVVQTHGFRRSGFLLDGPGGESSSPFAAQVLANAGFIVLQVQDLPGAASVLNREGESAAEGLRAGIDRLIADGLADALKVGIIGFSRTGYHVIHLLSRSPSLLAAATISDALQVGYWQYVAAAANNEAVAAALARLTGGSLDVANIGAWFARNPLYSLDRARAAIRLEETGVAAGLAMWETYAVLHTAHRPVELVLFPQGSHILKKPAERLASQGGNVDWFRFWLTGEEDPDVSKVTQYWRWRELRRLQATDRSPAPTPASLPRD